ncbi:MAG TPA: MobF family relaxase [Acidimicrobiales bacterium]|nr:MobF family relaxase [Acidimicrobiales bacterium]
MRGRAVTARTTTLRGAEAGRYYVEGALDYYVDRGEPPGVWRGAGAARLGLSGDINEEEFLNLMAGRDPDGATLLGTAHTDKTVRGFDVTCSAPKSASVLFAVGDDDVRRSVLEGHDAAVTAVVDWIERHAHCRHRIAGQVATVDAQGITAALFRQHTSRALDPQLHTHVVIVNRVLSPDGRWLALDARTIKRDQQTLSRLYHAGLRAELTRRLGVAWAEPVNGIAEMADMPADVLAEFSQRTRAVDARIDEKLERFTETMERAPTPRERWRLEREAVLDSRPPKTDADPTTLRDDWLARLADLGVEREREVGAVVGSPRAVHRIDPVTTRRAVEHALSALAEKQSTWRVAELVRELAAAVPTTTTAPADAVARWADATAATLVAERMVDLSRRVPQGAPLRRDGRPITEAAVDRILTLPAILAQEERLLALAARRLAVAGVDHPVESVDELTSAQRQLAVAVAGDRQLVLAVGPAGTGKTTALRPAVEQLRREGRAAFGVTPSATAAEVLATETGVDADTVDKLLVEHRLDRPPEHRYDLPAGATVIVDEAAMVPTPRLAELAELAERKAWRLALVGDPLQFAAVGRSGMFGHLIDVHGAIELGRVHRFTHPWERDASLRLRRGDVTVLEVYEDHGRLHGGTPGQMRRQVVDAWWNANSRGESASMMASSNEAVEQLNIEAQRRRLDVGHLKATARPIAAGPYRIHVGDRVATRHNERHLLTDRNRMVKNRDHWTVQALHRDGGLTVTGPTGTVRLPAAYVAEHVQLAYAETSHANQGRTVDHSYLYLDAPTGAAGIYVPMTRGRETNEAFVVTRGEQTAVDVIGESLARDWIDRPAVAVRAELHRAGAGEVVGTDLLTGDKVRQLFARLAQLERKLDDDRSGLAGARRDVADLVRQRARLEDTIKNHEERLEAARRTIADHDHPLRRRRHRPQLDTARRVAASHPDVIDNANARLAALEPRERAAAADLHAALVAGKQRPELIAEHTLVRYQLDQDAAVRGQRLAADAPGYLIDHIGPTPTDRAEASRWRDAAGKIAQHYAAFDAAGDALLDRQALPTGDAAYDSSFSAATHAINELDRGLHRSRTLSRERDIGISL